MTDLPPDPLLAVERGLAVFPIPVDGNRPATRGWQRSTLCDVEQVRRRWWPGDNVGIGCWMSGVVGLDLDVADGRHHTDVDGADTLAAQCAAHGQPWPDTLTIARRPAASTCTSAFPLGGSSPAARAAGPDSDPVSTCAGPAGVAAAAT